MNCVSFIRVEGFFYRRIRIESHHGNNRTGQCAIAQSPRRPSKSAKETAAARNVEEIENESKVEETPGQ